MKTFTPAVLGIVSMLSCAADRPSGEPMLRQPAKTSRILAFLPTETKSHFIGFKPLLEALVNRGHNITLVSPFPLDGAKLPYRYVEVEKTLGDFDMLKIAKLITFIPTPVHLWWFGPYNSELSLNKSSVTDFIRDDRSSFDLVLFENFYHECFAALGHKYGATLVQLLPFAANARVSQWQSNPYNPAYIPDLTSRSASNMTFAQRTGNTLAAFFYTAVNRLVYLPRQRSIVNKYFVYPGHELRPDLIDILRNVSLTLVNSHPIVGSAVPMVPSYVNVAGMHCVPPKELPDDLKRIVDDSEKGVVYFSLGSVIKSSKMPKETVSLLLSELSKIEQTVLWKWEVDEIPQLPKNVIIRKWFPQNDILGHPKCKLFITHGGVHSTIESIYYGVPMLALPVFGDQQGNSLRAQYRGMAIQVPYFDLTHEAFGSALHKLLHEPSYVINAKKISAIFNDNQLPPLENAVYWIEYVFRYGGATHLRTTANDLYWFQYFLLDVILVLSLFTFTFLWCTKKIVCFTVGKCCGKNVVTALLLATCFCCCHGLADTRPANILVFLPTETRSHFNGFKPLLEALVLRGHNLTLVSPYPLSSTAENGSPLLYTHVRVESSIKSDINHLDKNSQFNTLPHYLYVLWLGPMISRMALDKPAVKEFVARDDGTRYDLVVFENFFHECFVTLGHKFAAPVVQLVPFAENPRVSQWHGNPYNPSYVVDHAIWFAGPMTFWQRVHNTVSAIFHTWMIRLVYMPQQRAIADEHLAYAGHESRPDLETMLRNVSLTLINGHPLLGSSVAPHVPSYVHVAGMHVMPAKTLPRDLKTVLDNSGEHGVIYFSLGSVVKSSHMSRETVSLLLSEFAKIEQTVLWKWEDDQVPDLPKNVIVRKWFPQNDVLGHPNCRLFITHGGVHSLMESIYHAKPMLSIPVFGDQTHNSAEAELRGFALYVPYFQLTAEIFGTKLRRLLSEPKFAEAAKRASSILRDNPTPIMDKAIFWIEYVLRHNGAPHLRTTANDLYWFQLYLLDVIAAIFLSTLFVLYLNYKFVMYLWKKMCSRKSSIAKGFSANKKNL